MNPRILKKLSHKASPYVTKLTTLEQFRTERGESIENNQVMYRKHIERIHTWVINRSYFLAKKNTVGCGCMSGYYEPE
ncbi:MAG: hypothetical protein ACRBB6_12745 [Neptuniibacter sp.]